jgi:DNA-binding response OmpR family regulator
MTFNKQGNGAQGTETNDGSANGLQTTDNGAAPPAVLLLGDDPALLALLEEWLAAEGYAVVQGQPDDATREQPWQLVIVDVAFPRRGGAKVLQPIAQKHPDTPVLALSSTFVGRVECCGPVARALGVACVLPKPLTRAALLAAIERLLRTPPR